MLNKPSVFKIPTATGSANLGSEKACSYYNGMSAWTCSPYMDACVDTTYSQDSCGWGLGITAVGSVAAVVVIT